MELSVLEKFLHIPCLVAGYDGEEDLPLYLRGLYRLQIVKVAGISFLAAAPEDIYACARNWEKPAAVLKQSRASDIRSEGETAHV